MITVRPGHHPGGGQFSPTGPHTITVRALLHSTSSVRATLAIARSLFVAFHYDSQVLLYNGGNYKGPVSEN